jgi:hypothetical protein
MTRLVSWLDALLWWLDERRAIREHHLTLLTPVLSSGRRRGVWERRRRAIRNEAPASLDTTGRMSHREEASNEHHRA